MFRLLALMIGAAMALAASRPASAAEFAPGSICHAEAGLDEDYAKVAAQPARWDCRDGGWSIRSPRAFLRFDLRGRPAPDVLTTRLTRFAAMRLTTITADGTTASRDLGESGMTPATTDWLMSTPLPDPASDPEVVVVRIDGARHAGMLSDMTLSPWQPESAAALRGELLIAALCGMLWLPLLFNFAFFRVLRERFLLWHALAVTCMMSQTLITSGLINRFTDLSLQALCLSSAITFGVGVSAAALFSADFIEPGTIEARHRRIMRGAVFWIAGWTAFYLLADGPVRWLAPPLYLAAFAPMLAAFAWIMTLAARRGSRAVIFQIVAWSPIMITGMVRIISVLGFTDAPIEMQLEQHISLGFEVIVTTLSVADRFMAIRRQRDLAMADLRVVEDRAERDPLTGLLNRRAVEKRFDQLYADGFRTMAVIDLDKFKLVNDTRGHAVGDAVLRAAAEALEPDGDTLAIRMGGEEFLLLLRGGDANARAERRRQAIPARIDAMVPGLERTVTASMGLVEQSAGNATRADFAGLFDHCDRLLYEAKHAGRNHTMSERIQTFGPAKSQARAA